MLKKEQVIKITEECLLDRLMLPADNVEVVSIARIRGLRARAVFEIVLRGDGLPDPVE